MAKRENKTGFVGDLRWENGPRSGMAKLFTSIKMFAITDKVFRSIRKHPTPLLHQTYTHKYSAK